MSEKENARDDGAHANIEENLDPNRILIAEFGYAQETAAQAMEDRHKMVNYYLIIVGVLLNAVVILATKSKSEEIMFGAPEQLKYAASAFLFTLFIIGVLYLFMLIRLRRAWYQSAAAMNHIKQYYNDNLPNFKLIPDAFCWTTETLKKMKLNRNGTLFFYSAILIILINSLALGGGLCFLSFSYKVVPVCFALSLALQYAIYKSKLKGL